MKAIQRAHPAHHRNGFVATCRLWTASGVVQALLYVYMNLGIYEYILQG